jgi:hypothetical protein
MGFVGHGQSLVTRRMRPAFVRFTKRTLVRERCDRQGRPGRRKPFAFTLAPSPAPRIRRRCSRERRRPGQIHRRRGRHEPTCHGPVRERKWRETVYSLQHEPRGPGGDRDRGPRPRPNARASRDRPRRRRRGARWVGEQCNRLHLSAGGGRDVGVRSGEARRNPPQDESDSPRGRVRQPWRLRRGRRDGSLGAGRCETRRLNALWSAG